MRLFGGECGLGGGGIGMGVMGVGCVGCGWGEGMLWMHTYTDITPIIRQLHIFTQYPCNTIVTTHTHTLTHTQHMHTHTHTVVVVDHPEEGIAVAQQGQACT